MTLHVQPADLAAAGSRLGALAGRLADARADLDAAAAGALTGLGRDAASTGVQTWRAADRAVATLAADTAELARALRVLAEVYAAVDVTAVAGSP